MRITLLHLAYIYIYIDIDYCIDVVRFLPERYNNSGEKRAVLKDESSLVMLLLLSRQKRSTKIKEEVQNMLQHP